jgi:hypothetical protein
MRARVTDESRHSTWLRLPLHSPGSGRPSSASRGSRIRHGRRVHAGGGRSREQVMILDLTHEETGALARLLSQTINGHRYPLSPRIQTPKGDPCQDPTRAGPRAFAAAKGVRAAASDRGQRAPGRPIWWRAGLSGASKFLAVAARRRVVDHRRLIWPGYRDRVAAVRRKAAVP